MEQISRTVRPLGLEYRHVAGVDMLVDANQPSARSAIHLVFVREKVRLDFLRMKLTSLRLKDKVHIIDMDGVGLITPEIEAALRRCLQQVREEDRQ